MKAACSQLIDKGVCIPVPESVMIASDVDLSRISGNGVTIHPGCRLSGKDTFVHDGAELGREGPVSIENCQVGPDVRLNGGFFRQATFLAGASMGSGAHVREGCLLEESASGAHTVGLKQTILAPFVTLGSLINFCDCYMSGGTDRKNHSEVGSSFIHFNYTPNQDKATASLIGDVPRGVMLNQPPVFLGGQGGLVGPLRLTFGTVVAAGTIVRKDELRPNRLIFGGASRPGNVERGPGVYGNVNRILQNNLIYIANLLALREWYQWVRASFVGSGYPEALHRGACMRIEDGIRERIKRLVDCIARFEKSAADIRVSLPEGKPVPRTAARQQTLFEAKDRIERVLTELSDQGPAGDLILRDRFLAGMDKNGNYIETISRLPDPVSAAGTGWLESVIVEAVSRFSEWT